MSGHNNSNNHRNNSNDNIPLQPTIAAIPRTFEAQNRRRTADESLSQQQQSQHQPPVPYPAAAATTTTALFPSSLFATTATPSFLPPPPPFWIIHPPAAATAATTTGGNTPWWVATTATSPDQPSSYYDNNYNHHPYRFQQPSRTRRGGDNNNNEDGFDTIEFVDSNNNNRRVNSNGSLFDPNLFSTISSADTNRTATNNNNDNSSSTLASNAATTTTSNVGNNDDNNTITSVFMMNNDGTMTTINEPRAVALWRERERRQRTIRVFMMFLLMLLLMEDEPSNRNQQNHNNNNSNHTLNRLRGSNNFLNNNRQNNNNDNNNSWKYPKSLSPDVYHSRILQDDNLRILSRSHPRYHALIEKQRSRQRQHKYGNNKEATSTTDRTLRQAGSSSSTDGVDEYDYNEQILQYTISLSDMEKDEFDNNSNKVHHSSTGSSTTGSDAIASSSSSTSLASSASSSSSMTTMMKDPENERKVYHYPWNTTGFYRGHWKRITKTEMTPTTSSASSSSNKMHRRLQSVQEDLINPMIDSNGNQSTRIGNNDGVIDDLHSQSNNVILTTTTPNSDGDGTKIGKNKINTISILHESNTTTSQLGNNSYVNATDIEDTMLDILHSKKHELFGVHIIPSMYRLQTRDDNNLTTSKYEDIRYDQNNNRINPSSLPSYERLKPAVVNNRLRSGQQQPSLEDDRMNVTLSHDNGRAAFQLFSRSIPGMKEISIVEGFMKLYDSTSPGYSTSKDLLLRVRGVVIHSIGRLSLTANADISQAAFIMTPPSLLTTTTTATSSIKPRIVTENNGEASSNVLENRENEQQPSKLLGTTPKTRKPSSKQHRRRLRDLIQDIALFDNSNNIIQEIRQVATEYDDTLNSQNGLEEQQKQSNHLKEKSLYQFSWMTSDYGDNFDGGMIGTENMKQPDDDEAVPSIRQSLLSKSRTTLASLSAKAAVLVKSRVLQEKRDGIYEGNVTSNEEQQNETTKNTKLIPPWSDIVMPFPYVRDDEYETLRRTRTAAARLMPPRERSLERNAAHCLFEINMDIEPIEWTIGSWRTLLTNRIQEAKLLNPDIYMTGEELDINENVIIKEDDDISIEQQSGQHKEESAAYPSRIGIRYATNGGKRQQLESSYQRPSLTRKFMQDQALVMNMVGDIHSPNCDFAAILNVTALRTDWETTTSRAISYSFYMMLVCLTQILVLLRQLLHSQSSSTATRVSIICIGWQTVIDALLCLGHIYLSLSVQPLFTAFASVAFFKLLIFCVIEMKYMAIILQSRSNGNGQQQQDALRRQIPLMHARFYVSLMTVFIMFFYVTDNYRLPFMVLLYSFWVPQIILNIVTEAKAPMHRYYIYGMSVTRLFVPLYILALPGNFLKQVYPDTPYDLYTCEVLILWVGIQTALLIGQSNYGARFMIPARFLPPKFDYSRPIPASMLPPGASTAILLYEQKAHSMTRAETMDDRCEISHHNSNSNNGSSSTNNNNTSSINNSNHNNKTSMSLSPQSGINGDEYEPIRWEHHNTTAVTTRHRLRGQRAIRNDGHGAMTLENHRHTLNRAASPTRTESKKDTVKSNVSTTRSASLTPPSSPIPPSSCLMECSICYDDIDIRKRKDYMLAPCNHLFHRDCLSKWMDVKMECPICRTELPAL